MRILFSFLDEYLRVQEARCRAEVYLDRGDADSPARPVCVRSEAAQDDDAYTNVSSINVQPAVLVVGVRT